MGAARLLVGSLRACPALLVAAVMSCAPAAKAPTVPTHHATAPRAAPPPEAGPPIELHAKQATVHGRNARYEVGGGKDNIGFWTNVNDWVSWDFYLPQAGTYLVEITYACARDSGGSTYRVEFKPKGARAPVAELSGTIPATGSWTAFVTERLGVVELGPPGPYFASVKPLTKPHLAVMNLKAITLRPGLWEPGLAAWWRFDEGQGSVAKDSLLEVEDAVAYGRWVRGAFGGALRFNGLSTEVRRPAAKAPRFRNAFSIEAWVRLCGPSDGWSPIVNQHDFPLGYFFGLDGAGDLAFHVGVGGKWLACTSRVRLPAQRWCHVAATFDRRFGLAVYVDGEQTGRLWAEGRASVAEDVDLLIGKHNRLPWSFDGAIDELKLYGRALSAEEVRMHYLRQRARLQPPPRIALRAVQADNLAPRLYERVTLDLDLRATYDNPFEPEEISVEAIVATPSMKTWRVPGFLYQPFERHLVPDDQDPKVKKEEVTPAGPPRWQVRLAFTEPGTHVVRVSARDRTGRVVSEPLRFEVQPADVPGMVRRHPKDPRYFATDRGETFFPLGANVCWAGPRGTFDYDDWLSRYARSGCNLIRVWLSPFWTTFAMNTPESGFDAIDLGNAWRLDHVVQMAEKLGIRIMPCIDSFNILRSTERAHGNYEDAPYARTRGGPLRRPLDYFTHPRSLRAYRNRLRYLVARYGYSTSIFAWELWNEVNIIDDYDSEVVARWHATMARYLRQTDPWHHMVTTSFAGAKGDPAVFALPELDFTQTHTYNNPDLAKTLAEQLRANGLPLADKPHLYGEFGIAGSGDDTAAKDPTGIHLHNALYASVGLPLAGAPMTWWWDSYVHAKDLYGIFAAFSRWVAGFDFAAEKAHPARLEIVRSDFELAEPATLKLVKGTWSPAPFNRPLRVAVDRNGFMKCEVPLSDVLHGVGFHKKLHNPVTFVLDAPRPTTFGVQVKGVSGYGSANLRISLDGKLVLERRFDVPKGNKAPVLTRYNGPYRIKLPRGKHTVVVENTGKDWLSVDTYEIPWLKKVRVVQQPLRALGVVGEGRALVWVQNRLYTWTTAASNKPPPVPDATLNVLDLAPGTWVVEQWDTRQGKVLSRTTATVGPDGKLSITLPAIEWDIAFRLIRQR